MTIFHSNTPPSVHGQLTAHALNVARERLTRPQLDADAMEKPATEPDPDLVALMQRIMRKAEIMRIDARARGDRSVESDAHEIFLLAQIGLRKIGACNAV